MRLLILYTRLSGYIAACIRAFKNKANADILIYVWRSHENSPFDNDIYKSLGEIRFKEELAISDIKKFNPDAVLVSGWADKKYIRICRTLKSREVPVISGCDTQWRNTFRQRLACFVAPIYLHKFIDVLWGCGARQQKLAQKLGYCAERYWDDFYSCDWETFAKYSNEKSSAKIPPQFLYTGRLVPEKGIDTLVEAYRSYRVAVKNPWPLVIAGIGPLEQLLYCDGIIKIGFVQPKGLPKLMRESTAFILPSIFEPWGVVVHEAVTCGLPVILSDACGAGDHLLKPSQNGFLFTAGSSSELAKAMTAMHDLSSGELKRFREVSIQLSKQYTPSKWANTLYAGLESLGGR